MTNPERNIFHLMEELSNLLREETTLLNQRKDHEALSLLNYKKELIEQFDLEIQNVLRTQGEQEMHGPEKEQWVSLIEHLKELMHLNDVALTSAKQRREQILNIYVDAVKEQEKPAAFYTSSGHQRVSGAQMPALSVIREI